MYHYSRLDCADAQEFLPQISEAEFNDRLDAFFFGRPMPIPTTLRIGPTDAEIAARETVALDALRAKNGGPSIDPLDELEALIGSSPQPTSPLTQAEADEIRATIEYVDMPSRPTPFGRAAAALREAEVERDAAAPDSPEHHAALAKVASAKARYKQELQRSLDDGFRQLRAIDEYRMTDEGREERNRGLRKKREEPNQSLAGMTDAEKAVHRAAKAADRVWRADKRKAGWTEDRIAAGLAARQASRKAALTAS